MLKLASDENFNGTIIRGLFHCSDLDLVRVLDVGLMEAPDPDVLAWAAEQNRILLTHDRKTVPFFAYGRVEKGMAMPGVFLVSDQMPIGQAVDEILVAADCFAPEECANLVRFFPL